MWKGDRTGICGKHRNRRKTVQVCMNNGVPLILNKALNMT